MIEIPRKQDCCGCTACAEICPKNCIEMDEDQEGFLYPSVNIDDCINCGACERVCPILNHEALETNEEQVAYIVQNLNIDTLRESTSGGAFTSIAEYVIDRGGVVFGVEIQQDYTVRHIAVEEKKDLIKFRNSKYVQSFVGDSYKQVKKYLLTGRMVCFSGTPCQIEGLMRYLGKKYDNLVLVDVVCRAVPSPGVWKDYIHMVIRKNGEMESIRFRDKTLGYQYSTLEMKNSKGQIFRGGIESQPWLRMFFSGMIIRPSCTECKFRSKYRYSDFTIWDCFNVYSIDKSFDENVGTTRVLVHSQKGKAIFKQINKTFRSKEISVEMAINGVKEMLESPKENPRKAEFYRDYHMNSVEFSINKYFPITMKVWLKKAARLTLNRLGLDKMIKHFLKKG